MSGPVDTEASGRIHVGGPGIRLSTGTALLGVAAVLGGAVVFLLTTGAKGGAAEERLRSVEARLLEQARAAASHDAEDAAVRRDVAVHHAQIEQITKTLTSIDRKLERVIERLPAPAGPK